MVVVGLRGGEEGEVVAAVGVQGGQLGQLDPEPCGGNVGAQQHGA